MKWTNEYRLPPALAKAIQLDTYDYDDDPNHFAVHELIDPTRKTVLKRRHRDEIVMDVSQGLWLLFGSAVHEVISRVGDISGFQEKRLERYVGAARLSGKPDYWEDNRTLTDWKITSVWAAIKQDKKEWEAQLNCYAFLCSGHGFPVDEARIYAILRDWRNGERLKDPTSYPPIPFMNKPVNLWSVEKQEAYINRRLSELKLYKLRDERDLPICTEEERWTRGKKWAVMKEGRKSAVRLLHSEDEAHLYIHDNIPEKDKKKCDVVYRPGRDVRCEEYCDVNQFCSYYKKNVEPKLNGSNGS